MLVWNWKSHDRSLHGAILNGKVKQKVTPNKDGIRVTHKSGFYLGGCLGKEQGIEIKPCIVTKMNRFSLGKSQPSITLKFSNVKLLKVQGYKPHTKEKVSEHN